MLVTRARQRMIVVTALATPGRGLLGAYLEYARTPPSVPGDRDELDGWAAALAVELRRQGGRVRTGYDIGAHRVDIVLGGSADAVAIECRRHPDGTAAHIARRRLLHDAGWHVVEAWPSRYDDDPISAAVDLLGRRS